MENLISIDEFDEAPTVEVPAETMAQEALRWQADRAALDARIASSERPTKNIRPPVIR